MKGFKEGFTLIELMIVIAIISILAVTSIPKLGYNIQKSKDARVVTFLGTLRSSKTAYESDNFGKKPEKIDEMFIYFDNNFASTLTKGISSTAISSYQIKAGVVNKSDGTNSFGRDAFLEEKNIAEIYYNNILGILWIDGTTGSGVDFLDTKENKWNNY